MKLSLALAAATIGSTAAWTMSAGKIGLEGALLSDNRLDPCQDTTRFLRDG
jgi:hypothetical protein